MNVAGRAPPDFTRIRGIGEKAADALVAEGVASMADLAAMSIEEVVATIGRGGGAASPKRIADEGWLFQAWKIAREEAEAADPSPSTPSSGEAAATVDDWAEHAGLFVYFDHRDHPSEFERWRTRVWDTGTLSEIVLPGVAPEPWIAVVLARARLPDDVRSASGAAFEVDEAELEQRSASSGEAETWVCARVAARVDEGSFVAALGSAVWRGALGRPPP